MYCFTQFLWTVQASLPRNSALSFPSVKVHRMSVFQGLERRELPFFQGQLKGMYKPARGAWEL